jgi:glutathione S-transferase
MRLYFSPGACSLHPHIVLLEAGVPFELVRVDLRSHRLHDGTDFRTINPKGQVPVLRLGDGSILTEGAVIDQYVADLAPEKKLLPPPGTRERLRVQEWLNFIAAEIHKSFTPLFGQDEAVKAYFRPRLGTKLAWLDEELASHPFLCGEAFTVADAYLYNLLRWSPFTGIDLAKRPNLVAFQARIEPRPAVKAALAAEQAERRG